MTREHDDADHLEFLRKLGTMYNTFDVDAFAGCLGDDTVWESQHVYSSMTGRAQIGEYLENKVAAIERLPESGRPVAAMAEIAGLRGPEICLAVYQRSNESPIAVVLIQNDGPELKRIDVCGVLPIPSTATVSDDYPGITADEAARRLEIIGSDIP